MVDERTRDLIHAELDGEDSAADAASLAERLAADGSARAYQQEMRALSDTLAALPEAEPPTGLRQAIMAALRPPGAVSAPATRSSRTARSFFNYGYAVAAGALLASVAFVLAPRNEPRDYDIAELVGTMGGSAAPAASAQVNMTRVDLDTIEGTVSLFRLEDILIVEFDMQSREAIEIVAGVGDQPVRVRGVAPLDDADLRVSATARQVTVVNDGDQHFALMLGGATDGAVRVDLAFRRDGQPVHEMSLQFAAAQ